MRTIDQIGLSFWAISANKVRSFAIVAALTAGIGAVVMVTSIIAGFGQQIEKLSFGVYARSLVIMPNFVDFNHFNPPKLVDLDRLSRQLNFVEDAIAWRSEKAQAYIDGKYAEIDYHGVWGKYSLETSNDLQVGRHLELEETRGSGRLCILGHDLKNKLFTDSNPTGKSFRLNGTACKVIGILAEPRTQNAEKFANSVIMPFHAAARYFSDGNFLGPNEASRLTIVLANKDLLYDSKIEADLLLRKSRGVPLSQVSPFTYDDPSSSTRAVKRQNQLLSQLLIGLASVSLISGLIGFSTIMTSSVVERQREIALQMTIGAHPRDIVIQIIIQALILGFIGGLCGIVFGSLLAYFASTVSNWPFQVTVSILLLAVALGLISGIVAGILPARKASQAPPALAARL